MQSLQLELRHYETVVAIVEFETMTEAAKQLSSSQSALSHRLAEAERRLGTRLFDRGRHRRLTPTRNGLAVHQAATRALEDLGRVESSLQAQGSLTIETVRIAVGSYDCYHWFPSFLGRVREQQPNVDLELVVVGDAPGTALASRAVDIVIAAGLPDGTSRWSHSLRTNWCWWSAVNMHSLALKSFRRKIWRQRRTSRTTLSRRRALSTTASFVRPGPTLKWFGWFVRPVPSLNWWRPGVGVSILSRWALEPVLESGRIASVRCGTEGLALTWHAATRRTDDLARIIVDELALHLQEAA